MTLRTLKAGLRLRSAVSDTQIMVLKAPAGEFDLRCGGVPLIDMAATAEGAVEAADDGETLTGKRYVDATEALEVLCTKGGRGSLSANGERLQVKQAKALPSSD